MSESSSVIFYAKCGIGKLIKRWLGVEHDIVFFSSVGEAVKSAKMYLHKSFVNSIKNKSVKNWNILGFIITIENLTVATKIMEVCDKTGLLFDKLCDFFRAN